MIKDPANNLYNILNAISKLTKSGLYYPLRGYFLSNPWINHFYLNQASGLTNLFSLLIYHHFPLTMKILYTITLIGPTTCHINCKNSDCQFSIVSLKVSLK